VSSESAVSTVSSVPRISTPLEQHPHQNGRGTSELKRKVIKLVVAAV